MHGRQYTASSAAKRGDQSLWAHYLRLILDHSCRYAHWEWLIAAPTSIAVERRRNFEDWTRISGNDVVNLLLFLIKKCRQNCRRNTLIAPLSKLILKRISSQHKSQLQVSPQHYQRVKVISIWIFLNQRWNYPQITDVRNSVSTSKIQSTHLSNKVCLRKN